MEEIQLVLFIFGNNLKQEITKLLTTKYPTFFINSEYIPSEEDQGITPYDDIEDPVRKAERRNKSVIRALTRSGKKLFIVELETIPPDLLAVYISTAKSVGYKLMSLTITHVVPGGSNYFISLMSSEFAMFAKLFEINTEGTKIVSGTDQNERYIGIGTALTESKPLIVINSLIIGEGVERTSHRDYATNYRATLVDIETGLVDVKSAVVLVKGKPLEAAKLAVTSDPGTADLSKTNGFKGFFKGSGWKTKWRAFTAWCDKVGDAIG